MIMARVLARTSFGAEGAKISAKLCQLSSSALDQTENSPREKIPFRSRDADGYQPVDRWRFQGENIRPDAKRPRAKPRLEFLRKP
jgi:hypothetical protein